jgi:hypothetical protein
MAYNDEEMTNPIPCSYCGRIVEQVDIMTIQVARQTWDSPAEYEDFCPYCLPPKYSEPDPDRFRE